MKRREQSERVSLLLSTSMLMVPLLSGMVGCGDEDFYADMEGPVDEFEVEEIGVTESGLSNPSSQAISQKVAFNDDTNYQGLLFTKGAGESFNVPPEYNDRIASVNVPTGYRVKLWRHYDRSQPPRILTASQPHLGSFTDQVSSIQVERIKEPGIYRIMGKASNRCVKGQFKLLSLFPTIRTRTDIEIWDCRNDNRMRFHFKQFSDGYYQIRDQQEGKCLSVATGSRSNGARIVPENCYGGAHQRFRLQELSDGSYVLRPKHASGKCLDVYFGNDNGNPVRQHQYGGGNNQKFILIGD